MPMVGVGIRGDRLTPLACKQRTWTAQTYMGD